MLYLYAACLAFHSLGIRANAWVGFPRAKTAPGGQTKPNGCIVFLVPVSCSGQRSCGAGVWGFRCVATEWAKSFVVRHMMYMPVVSQIVCFWAFGDKGVISFHRKCLSRMLCHHNPPEQHQCSFAKCAVELRSGDYEGLTF